MTVPYQRLVIADVGRWQASAAAWRALAARTGERSAAMTAEAMLLAAGWSGGAAAAAVGRLGAHRRLLDVSRTVWWEADQALSVFASEVARARRLLEQALALARRTGVAVSPTGTVTSLPQAIIAPGPHGIDPRSATAGSAPGRSSAGGSPAGGSTAGGAGPDGAVAAVVTALQAALDVAARADAEAASRLAGLAAGLQRPGPGAAAAVTPPCGAAPAAVRAWWDTLTPEQRRWLVATQPVAVGGLDGVPAAARDQANRLLLDRALAGAPSEGLARLAERLGREPRAYLLGFDAGGDGRAVVAVGDPDRAEHVVTHVPGMTSTLERFERELDRAAAVAARAGELAPGARTAGVLWLGYDAPDLFGEAASARHAEAGAVELRRFQEGLRADHLTVVGHSYGSLVVGTAARDGLAADDVVFVGSPGVGAQSADELDAGRVWATSSRTDPVQYAAISPGSLPADLVTSMSRPGIGSALAFARPEEDLWHGPNPAGEAFGANVFRSQVSAGHLGYWAADGPALDNLARITVGDAGGVTRP